MFLMIDISADFDTGEKSRENNLVIKYIFFESTESVSMIHNSASQLRIN